MARRQVDRPVITRKLLSVFVTKALALLVLLGASGLMYDVASSPTFQVSRVTVVGNQLLSTEELTTAASTGGLNLFWLRRGDVERRLKHLPPVDTARVALQLPDHVLIQVEERVPVAIWLSGEIPFLVDRDGLLLAARPADRQLMVVRDTSEQVLEPGAQVDPDIVRRLADVDALLAGTFGPQERRYEYSGETGLNVVQTVGARLVLGDTDNLEWKASAIKTIVRHLESTRTPAELIDVRFSDRPYYR